MILLEMDQQKFLKQEQEKTLLQIVHYRNFMFCLLYTSDAADE